MVPPATAAFVNAFQMHCLEFDCVHEGAVAHAMTAVTAAVLAETDRVPVDGRRLILAVAVGVEVAVALGVAARAPLRFFRPATVGVFGAAVAVGVLRGFDGAAVRRCFGHALGHAAGTMQAHEEGKPTLAVQLGAAARAGVVAADLAGAGVPAPSQALEGRHGYFRLFETAFDTADAAPQAGRAWRVTELSHKPYPSGRATHGGIEAVLRLRAVGVTPDNLAEVTLAAPPLIHQLVVRPAFAGMDASYARLCFPPRRRGRPGLWPGRHRAFRRGGTPSPRARHPGRPFHGHRERGDRPRGFRTADTDRATARRHGQVGAYRRTAGFTRAPAVAGGPGGEGTVVHRRRVPAGTSRGAALRDRAVSSGARRTRGSCSIP